MERDYQVAVFIGRFQPIHSGHKAALEEALRIADKVIVIIGSYNVASNIKNPFSYEERKEMITSLFKETTVNPDGSIRTSGDYNRIHFIPVRDYYYNDNLWVAEIQQKTTDLIAPNDSVTLVGGYKDSSSYYLNLFPQWDFTPIYPKQGQNRLDATDVRNAMYERDEKLMDYNPYQPDTARKSLGNIKAIQEMIPSRIFDWMEKNYFLSVKYHNHVVEFNDLRAYRKRWDSSPFPPTFITVDTVVVCSGHVLIVKRKFNPGKGLWALPGGFIKSGERLEDAALRELREETAINLNKLMLKNCIVESKVFDYPNRSLRGRTITHAYHIKIKEGELPAVKASSDAEIVKWMPIADIYHNEDKFFEDHFQMIQYFITRG